MDYKPFIVISFISLSVIVSAVPVIIILLLVNNMSCLGLAKYHV